MRRLLPDPGPLDDDGLVAAYTPPPGRYLRVNFIESLDGADQRRRPQRRPRHPR